MTGHEIPQVETCEDLKNYPAEYQQAVHKLVISHAINELHGARVYDEPAVALAPTPYAKWLTCRVAMEEYGHHVRFFELGRELGITEDRMLPEQTEKKPLSIFDLTMETWPQFCALKMLGDLAEILQVEDLVKCSFHPLRNLSRMTMPEERFHAQFGLDFASDLCETEDGRAAVQEAVDMIFPVVPAFFGRDKSKNNEIYRRWGIKERTNEQMRADYVTRARESVEGHLGLKLPALDRVAAVAVESR